MDGLPSEGDKFTLATPKTFLYPQLVTHQSLPKRLLRHGDVLFGVYLFLSRSRAHTGCLF